MSQFDRVSSCVIQFGFSLCWVSLGHGLLLGFQLDGLKPPRTFAGLTSRLVMYCTVGIKA